MAKLREYQNLSATTLEITEVGKTIRERVVVQPGEVSAPVRVTDRYHHYITEQTGFARVVNETEVEDVAIPEGYIEITEAGTTKRKFRAMTPAEREEAGLGPLPAPTPRPERSVQLGGQPAAPKATPAPASFPPSAKSVPPAADQK